LQCPECKHDQLEKKEGVIHCHNCHTDYAVTNDIPVFMTGE